MFKGEAPFETAVVADEAATRAQYVKVGKPCSACHDKYRKPKD